MNLRHLRIAFVFAAATGLASLAQAQLTFSFTYTDVGTGFNDPTLGATRQSALQSAADTLAGYFTGYNVNVGFSVNSYITDDGTLAYAGSGVSYSGNGFYATNVQKLIQTGSGTSDGSITFNFFNQYDYSDSVANGSYDFKSTAMHEMLHTLGFSSFIESDGTSVADANVWTTFDSFLVTNTGSSLINTGNYAFDGPLSTLTGGSANGVFFGGANAKAANGGNAVPIYSPDPYETGSSGSHTDDYTYTDANALMMNAATGSGQGIRTLSAIELGILQDIGYNVTAVPEPSTYALLFGSAAMLVVMVRQRRKRRAS